MGLVLPAGTAALAFGAVMGVLTPKLPRMSAASGIATAGAGVGSAVFVPVMQALTGGRPQLQNPK